MSSRRIDSTDQLAQIAVRIFVLTASAYVGTVCGVLAYNHNGFQPSDLGNFMNPQIVWAMLRTAPVASMPSAMMALITVGVSIVYVVGLALPRWFTLVPIACWMTMAYLTLSAFRTG